MSPPLFLNFYRMPFFYSFVTFACMLHYALYFVLTTAFAHVKHEYKSSKQGRTNANEQLVSISANEAASFRNVGS